MGRVTFFRVKRVEKAEGDEGPGASDWGADMIYTRRGFHPQRGCWVLANCSPITSSTSDPQSI